MTSSPGPPTDASTDTPRPGRKFVWGGPNRMTTLAPEHTVPTMRTGAQRTAGLVSLRPWLTRPAFSCGKARKRAKPTRSKNIGCKVNRQQPGGAHGQ